MFKSQMQRTAILLAVIFVSFSAYARSVLCFALILLALGTLMTGILPQFWVALASQASVVGGQ